MPSHLQQFKRKAFAKPGVRAAYDEPTEEFAFLDEVLIARIKTDQKQAADVETASYPTCEDRPCAVIIEAHQSR